QLHQNEIDLAKKYAGAVAKAGGISVAAAEARIERQLLRWADKTAFLNDGEKIDELVVGIIGKKGQDNSIGIKWDFNDYGQKHAAEYNNPTINQQNIGLYSPLLSSINVGITPAERDKRAHDGHVMLATGVGCILTLVGCAFMSGFNLGEGGVKIADGDTLGGSLQMVGGVLGFAGAVYGPLKAGAAGAARPAQTPSLEAPRLRLTNGEVLSGDQVFLRMDPATGKYVVVSSQVTVSTPVVKLPALSQPELNALKLGTDGISGASAENGMSIVELFSGNNAQTPQAITALPKVPIFDAGRGNGEVIWTYDARLGIVDAGKTPVFEAGMLNGKLEWTFAELQAAAYATGRAISRADYDALVIARAKGNATTPFVETTPKIDAQPSGPLLPQQTDSSCVSASCRMAANLGEIPESWVRGELGTSVTGTSLSNVPQGLAKLKFEGKATYVDNMSLQGMKNVTGKGDVVIISVWQGEGKSHAMVLDKIEGGRAFIRDPWPERIGKSYSITVEVLKNIMTGRAVVVQKQR
ncbi:hypothetical protein PO883_34150, partial [Massilia sp. DJPM01]|uniref:hypothetical protein n=1 Tax=Massilia sp. DJPM01 TaxID=3024404 RepID=UPI00259D38A7